MSLTSRVRFASASSARESPPTQTLRPLAAVNTAMIPRGGLTPRHLVSAHATVADRHGGPWTFPSHFLSHGSFVAAVAASVDASPSQRLSTAAVLVAVQPFHGGFLPPFVVCLQGGFSFFSFALGLVCQGGSDLLICGRDRTFSLPSCQGAEEHPRSPASSSSD